MPMSARWRNQRHQTFDQFERRQHHADAAAGTWFDALMDQMAGVDFTQTPQREGGASTVAQQLGSAAFVKRRHSCPEASASQTSAMTMQWKCTCELSSAPRRWIKTTAPLREPEPAAGQPRHKPCATTLKKIRSASVSITGSCCRL